MKGAKLILLALFFVMSISACGSSSTSTNQSPDDQASDDADTAPESEAIAFDDQFGGHHVYIPAEESKILLSSSSSGDNVFYTIHDELEDGRSHAMQFDQSGLISRVEAGESILQIGYLGQAEFFVNHTEGGSVVFSGVVEVDDAAKRVGYSLSEDRESGSFKILDRNRTADYTISLVCDTGMPLKNAELRMFDTSVRDSTVALSGFGLVSLFTSNANYPVNLLKVDQNRWLYRVDESSLEEASEQRRTSDALNNACAFQDIMSTALSLLGFDIGHLLRIGGIACNTRALYNNIVLARDISYRGVISNDSDVHVYVTLPEMGLVEEFSFNVRDVERNYVRSLDVFDERYCASPVTAGQSVYDGAPFNPEISYVLPDPGPGDPGPGDPGPGDPGPGDPGPGDPGPVSPGSGYSVLGVWATCWRREFSNGDPLSVATQIEFSEDGSVRELYFRYVGDQCGGEPYTKHKYSGKYSVESLVSTAEGVAAAMIEFSLEREEITLSFGSSIENDCRGGSFYQVVGREGNSIYPSFDAAVDATFLNRIQSRCRPVLSIDREPLLRLDFERGVTLCSADEISGATQRPECAIR